MFNDDDPLEIANIESVPRNGISRVRQNDLNRDKSFRSVISRKSIKN